MFLFYFSISLAIGGVGSEDQQVHLRSECPAKQTRAFVRGHVACRFVVNRANEVAGAESRLCRRRTLACGDDAQVVLPDQLDAVFDDIRKTRQSDFVNNFWRALAHDPRTLRRTWESIKEVMAPGALEPKIKEMLYVAASVAHGCNYCIHSHTAGARAKGMTDQEYAEMIAIVGMAAETNRLVTALGVAIDDVYLVDLP